MERNNPVTYVLEEATSIFPVQCISCIGSGGLGAVGFNTISATDLSNVMKKLAKDSERISEEVAKHLSNKDVFYCRLNVVYGLQDIGFKEWEMTRIRTSAEK